MTPSASCPLQQNRDLLVARGSRSRAQAGGQGQSLKRRMGVKAKGQQGQTRRRGRGGEGGWEVQKEGDEKGHDGGCWEPVICRGSDTWPRTETGQREGGGPHLGYTKKRSSQPKAPGDSPGLSS